MNLIERFFTDLTTISPEWMLIGWQVFFGVMAVALIFALWRPEARAILVGTVMGVAMVLVIYAQFGYSRIIGVGHILFWTPTLFYMVSLLGTGPVVKTWFGRWLWLAILVMAVALSLDYFDLGRYLFGDRQILTAT